MSKDSQDGWSQRLIWSGVLGTATVILSTLFFLMLESGHPSRAEEVASYVIGVPLLPGVGFVSIFWGSWQAIHQGQIAFIPPVSILIDSAIIFAVSEFAHVARSPKPDVHSSLNLRG